MKLRLLISALFLSLFSFAQQYGNEWIKFNQTYYKFELNSNGMYRIPKSVLVSSGVPITTINPLNIQIFGRGQEIPIYIEGEQDGKFDDADYIEFYAQKNDAWLDSVLFEGTENVTNPYNSVIGNDTAAYFLTWNTSTTNSRYTVQNDFDFSGIQSYDHIKVEKVYDYGIDYTKGPTYAELGFAAGYQKGEGRVDDVSGTKNKNSIISINKVVFKTITNEGIGTGNVDAEIRLWYFSDAVQNPDHHIKMVVNNNGIIPDVIVHDSILEGVNLVDHKFTIGKNVFTNNSIHLGFIPINDLGAAADNSVLVFSKFKYNHQLDLLNKPAKSFKLEQSVSSKLLDLQNVKALNEASLYNHTSKIKYPLLKLGASYKAKIANPNNNEFVIASDSITKNVTSLKKVIFIDYINTVKDKNYVIITHKNLKNEAQNYQDYRTSKGYTTALIDIDQLYNQFSYGIKYNPLSVKYFINYAYDKWIVKPEYLFIIGKGVSPDAHIGSALVPVSNNLVPTYGTPGSDQMLVSGINGTTYDSPISVGRLSAVTNEDVASYLNKVKEYESQPYAEWMKRALHFSGGKTGGEQTVFRGYVDNYASIFENSNYGGVVLSQSKASSLPFDISLQDSIRALIKTGSTIMTYFGHSGGGNFDVSLDRVETWENEPGRYPFLLANACYSGNIFGAGSASENYLMIPNKGVIGYYAHAGAGYAYPVHLFSQGFYNEFSNYQYGKPVGKSIQSNIQKLQANLSSEFYRSTFLNSAFHGDPAIVLNAPDKPDFEVTASSLFYNPETVTSDLLNFKANIIVKNIGKAYAGPITIRLIRKYEKERPQPKKDTTYTIEIPNLYYIDTVSFLLDVDPINGDGTNKFEIQIDPLNAISELSETNNTVNNNLVISSGVITPIYPYEYQVVPNKDVVLRGVTIDPFLAEKTYTIQVSKKPDFTNLLLNTIVTETGGVIEQSFTNMDAGSVYYWRVTSNANNPNLWRTSSFQYIANQVGWGQADAGQFTKDPLTFLDFNGQEFKFKQSSKNVYVYTRDDGLDVLNTGFYLDGVLQEGDACANRGFIFVGVIDGKTLKSWESAYFPLADGSCVTGKLNHFNCDKISFNNANVNGCGGKIPPDNYFVYGPSDGAGVVNMIKDVPKGDYIVMWGFKNVNWRSWDQASVDYFTNTLGAKAWSLPDTVHGANTKNGYAFFTKKGDPTTTVEEVSDSGSVIVELNAPVFSEFSFGEITSVNIGPAKTWQNFQWKYTGNANDSVNFDVIGIRTDGNEVPLFQNIVKTANDSLDISSVNATTYPNIKLNMFLKDELDLTAPQLKEWHVYLGGVGDAAINPKKGLITSKDTLGEGENFKFSIVVQNISDYDMDSLLVSFYIEDANRVIHTIPNIRVKALKAGDTTFVSIIYPTNGLRGKNKLWMEINPNNDQPEQYIFNNFATYQFYVSEDDQNPILDVTVDGSHILNGDIISAKPHFLIKLTDEHPNLALNDTSLFQMFLFKEGDGGALNQIFFKNSANHIIDYTPATLPNNKFTINYYPTLEDGKYTLTIKAIDRSNNRSGNYDYTLNFEVINKATITKIVNWPNPFTTSTRFVFELTGSQIPTEFKIQILNVSGTVVKEVTKDEIGPIKIGRNISSYAWDGTDTYGDRLGNGVYFYKVITNLNGSEIENRKTDADKYFVKEFGKMYLMR